MLQILDLLLQVLAGGASIGRVYTPHRVIGRRWNAAALLLIAIDYSVNYIQEAKDIHFTGAVVFWALTLRTAAILAFRLDGHDRWRQWSRALIAAAAWLVCAAIVVWNQYCSGGFNPTALAALRTFSAVPIRSDEVWYLAKYVVNPTVIALAGLGLGCLGEAMGDMVRTRRCILGMGILMAGFAIATQNWGQLFKNAVAGVTASVFSAIEFQDRPLPDWFPRASIRLSTGVRRFRSRF